MHKTNSYNLSSIPENNEQEATAARDWVSKKKHDVLKAKYKCLKKLFQIYDATLVGILPENQGDQVDNVDDNEPAERRRKKRSYLTKTDALVGTTESFNGDMSSVLDSEKCSVTTSVSHGLNTNQSLTVTHVQSDTKSNTLKDVKYSATQEYQENTNTLAQVSNDSLSCISTVHDCPCENYQQNPIQTCQPIQNPYLVMNETRKLTRFQSFIQRILGIRPEKIYKPYMLPNGQICSFSDNNIYHYRGDNKRRRRRVRFRRFRRPKKFLSEGAIRDKSPEILSYVQSVQRNCLMDTTPRQCPFVGCQTMFYGIINYNDHLNLCHFSERIYVCHYCHEGFRTDLDKNVHENEHIGITKLVMPANINSPMINAFCNNNYKNTNSISNNTKNTNSISNNTKASDTQTEPAAKGAVTDDKLKKIVSFFDKIVESQNTDQYFNEMKKQFSSNSHMRSDINETSTAGSKTSTAGSKTSTAGSKTTSAGSKTSSADSKTSSNEEQRTVSCTNTSHNYVNSDFGSCSKRNITKCHICGEIFDNRRQLSMHVDIEHRIHSKFSKFHSCVGLMRDKRKKIDSNNLDLCSKSGELQVESVYSNSDMYNTDSGSDKAESGHALRFDGSSNIVYFSSADSLDRSRPSLSNKQGIHSYKWKPGTKIIRV